MTSTRSWISNARRDAAPRRSSAGWQHWKTFFDFLAEESGELKWDNPVRFKRHAGKQPRRLPRDLSNEKIEHLYGRIESARDRAWFVLMWRAGLRVGEVASLKVTDVLTPAVNEQAAQLKVKGKGQKERIVLLSADAYAVLAEWLACRPKGDKLEVFLNERGQPLKANGIAWLLKGYGQQVEMPRQSPPVAAHVCPTGDRSGHADHQPE